MRKLSLRGSVVHSCQWLPGVLMPDVVGYVSLNLNGVLLVLFEHGGWSSATRIFRLFN
jgi:hypothetical protein